MSISYRASCQLPPSLSLFFRLSIMSMLNKLKETQKNPVFMEEDDDIDNMDFPLPGADERSSASSSSAAGPPNMDQLQNLMRNLSTGAAGGPQATQRPQEQNPIAVAQTPQGVRRLDPSQYKEYVCVYTIRPIGCIFSLFLSSHSWVCIYPCYIDATKSVQDGRKISKEKCIENPNAYHMAVAVQQLGLSVVYEVSAFLI